MPIKKNLIDYLPTPDEAKEQINGSNATKGANLIVDEPETSSKSVSTTVSKTGSEGKNLVADWDAPSGSTYTPPPATSKETEVALKALEMVKPNYDVQTMRMQQTNSRLTQLDSDINMAQQQMQKYLDLYALNPSDENKAKFDQAWRAYNTLYDNYNDLYEQSQDNIEAYNQAAADYQKASYRYSQRAQADQQRFEAWKNNVRDLDAINADISQIDKQIAELEKQYGNKSDRALGEQLLLPQTGVNESEQLWRQQAAYNLSPEAQEGMSFLEYADDNTKQLTVRNATAQAKLEDLKKERARLAEEADARNLLDFSSVIGNTDFQQFSQYQSTANGKASPLVSVGRTEAGYDDIVYEYINKNPDVVAKAARSGQNNYFMGTGYEDKLDLLSYMTDSEIAIYDYWYAKDRDKANEYIDWLCTSRLNNERWERLRSEISDINSTAMGRIGMSTVSVLMSPMKGITYLAQIGDILTDGKIDTTKAYNVFSKLPNEIRNDVSQKIMENASSTFWGDVGSFAYQTGMSMGDFLINMGIGKLVGGGSAAAAEWITLMIMGTGAAADATIAAKERGLSDWQSFLIGTAAGAAEIVTEKVSIEALLEKTTLSKSAFGYWLKNVIAEGTEEVASDLINTIVDVMVAKDKNEWETEIQALTQSLIAQAEAKGEGLTYEQAYRQAFWKVFGKQAAQMGLDWLGGGISGGIMAEFEILLNRYQGRANMRNTINTVDESTASIPSDRISSDQRQATFNIDGKPRTFTTNAISVETAEENTEQKEKPVTRKATAEEQKVQRNIMTEALIQSGLASEEDSSAYKYAQKMADKVKSGQTLTSGELAKLNRLNMAQIAYENAVKTVERTSEATKNTNLTLTEFLDQPGNEDLRNILSKSELNEAWNNGRTGHMTQFRSDTDIDTGFYIDPETGKYTSVNPETVETNQNQNGQLAEGGNINGQQMDNRAGSQRQVGIDTRGSVRQLEGSSGQNTGGRGQGNTVQTDQRARAAEIRNAAADLRYTTSGELGIRGGSNAESITTPRGRVMETKVKALSNDSDIVRTDPMLSGIVADAEKNGYNVRFFVGGSLAVDGKALRGMYDPDTNTLWIRADHDDFSAEQLWRHENFHRQIAGDDSVIAEAIRNIRSDPEGKAKFDRIFDQYAKDLAGTKTRVLYEEILADAYAGMDWSLAGDVSQFAGEAQATLDRKAAKTENASATDRTTGPPKNSIEQTDDGRFYVNVDEDILAGVPKRQWLSTFRSALKEKFPDGFTIGNTHFTTPSDTRGEITLSEYSKDLMKTDPSTMADKLRASYYLDELAKVAVDWIEEEPRHYEHNRFVSVGRGYLLFKAGANKYKAEFVAGTRSSGNTLAYDIVGIEPTDFTEKSTPNGSFSSEINPRSGDASSEDNISQSDIPVKTEESNGAQRFSIATYESSGRDMLHDYVNRMITDGELSWGDGQALIKGMDKVYEVAKQFKETGKSYAFSSWSDASVVVDENGNPMLSIIVPNGEYPLNIDFSTICKKGLALNAVLNALVRDGSLKNSSLNGVQIAELNNYLAEEGFEVACVLCFVDAKRYNVDSWANKFQNKWNKLIDSLGVETGTFDFVHDNGTNRTVSDAEADFTEIDKIIAKGGSNEQIRMAQAIRNNPELRNKVTHSDFISSAGLDNIKKSNPELYKLLNASGGTSKPKLAHTSTQYINDIINNPNFTPEAAFSVGGVRMQSFSDFVPSMFFDYVQMVSELQAKGLPAQAYTKVESFVRLFGQTGIKTNLSLIPAVQISAEDQAYLETLLKEKYNGNVDKMAEGIRKDPRWKALMERAGLDENGGYVWDKESFDYETALQIENDPAYTKNVGTICVGVSDAHIWKLLADPDIRMVIPYHKSGINPAVAFLRNIGLFKDYTLQQRTRRKENGKLKAVPAKQDFDWYNGKDGYKGMRDNGYDAYKTSVEYLKWCEEKGYTPKFDGFARNTIDGMEVANSVDGTTYNPNYYKLLIDYNAYDVDGNVAPQEAVRLSHDEGGEAVLDLPQNYMDILQDALVSEDETATRLEGRNLDDVVKGAKKYLDDKGYGIKGARYSQELDEEYLQLAKDPVANEAQLNEMVKQAAEAAGYDSPKLYHGSKKYGFTSFDLSAMDDGQSIFLTDSPYVAESYSGTLRTGTPGGPDREMVNGIRPEDAYSMPIDRALSLYNQLHEHDGKSKSVLSKSDLNGIIEDELSRIHETGRKAQALLNNPDRMQQIFEALNVGGDEQSLINVLLTSVSAFAEASDTEAIRKANENYNNIIRIIPVTAYGGLRTISMMIGTDTLANDPRFVLKNMNLKNSPGNLVWDGSDYGIWYEDQIRAELEQDLRAETVDESYAMSANGRVKRSGNYVVYAKYSNPLKIEGGETNWDDISFMPDNLKDIRRQMRRIERQHARGSGPISDNAEWAALDRQFWDEADALYDKYELNINGGNNTRAIAAYAKDYGYDAVIFEDVTDVGGDAYDVYSSNVYVIFNPDSVKSADPVTYDDSGNVIPLSERFNQTKGDIRYSQEVEAPVSQAISSAKTSIKQIPALFKNDNVEFGDVNVDIGGGRFDLATNYLAQQGTRNLVFDPYNRSAAENTATLDYLMSGNRADTATCANVLNVIAEPAARANVILEAAKAIKEDGTAYFMVYEGDGTGVGKETSSGWQNNRKTADYMDEIEQYFDNVQRKGKLIIATEPAADLPQASWETSPGNATRYSEEIINSDREYDFDVTQQDINEYVDKAYVKENTEDYKKYLYPSYRLINDVRDKIPDIEEYVHALRDNDLRHIKISHGENTNEKYPVTANDLKVIPDIVQNYDKVYVVPKGSKTGVIYVKVAGNNLVYYLEAATDKYGNENLLVNKQMIKTGINDIPNLIGLKEAITKEQPLSEFLADLRQVREVYARSVYQKDSVLDDRISRFGGDVNTRRGSEETDAAIDYYIRKYGQIKEGEQPFRGIRLPKQTGDNQYVTRAARTAAEAQATTDELAEMITDEVVQGTFSYAAITDEEAISNAKAEITANGWQNSLADWTAKMRSHGRVTKQDVVMGQLLYLSASQAGDNKTAISILHDMADGARQAGQAVQAQRILKKLSPEDQMYNLQMHINTIEKRIRERYHNKNASISIPEDLKNEYMTAPDQAARDEVLKRIYKAVADQIPADMVDKWNNWRYFSMLLNPRTHIRNVFGNLFFAPVWMVKDTIGSGLEATFLKDKGERSKSVLTLSNNDRALFNYAWQTYDAIRDVAMGAGKYNDSVTAGINSIEEQRTIFQSKIPVLKQIAASAEVLRKLNTKALDAEDVWFSKPAFATAMAQSLKAKGISYYELQQDPGKYEAQVQQATEYAVKEAQKATYRDSNAISDWVSSLGKNKVTKFLMGGLLPFKRTPTNIALRAIEYSPLGIFRNMYQYAQMKKGNVTAAEVLDGIASTLTGTMLFGLGVFGALHGAIRASGSGDKDKDAYMKMLGYQNWALELGGKSYTIDWLAPEAIPLLTGAATVQALAGESDKDILDALTSLTEPFLEMSMVSSLNDALDNISYSENKIVAAATNMILNYISQAVPTLGGTISRIIDPVQRKTYVKSGQGELITDAEYTIFGAGKKIPGLASTYQPYVNLWGEIETGGTLLNRAASNLISPGYGKIIEQTPTDDALLELYYQVQDSNVFPDAAPKYFNIKDENGETVRLDLDADQYTEYAIAKGQLSYDLVTEFVESDLWETLDPSMKADIITDMYTYANAIAKESCSPYEITTSWIIEAQDPSAYGMSTAEYIAARAIYGGVTNLRSLQKYKDLGLSDEKAEQVWKTISSLEPEDGRTQVSTMQKYEALYNISGLSDKDLNKALSVVMSDSAYKKMTAAESYDIGSHEWIDFQKALVEHDADGNGSYKQAEIADALDSMYWLTNEQRAALWQIQSGSTSAKNNPYDKTIGQQVIDAR